MRQTKILIGVGITITIISVVAYLCLFLIFTHENNEPDKKPNELAGTPLTHVPLDEIYKDVKPFDENDYNLIDEDPKADDKGTTSFLILARNKEF